MVNSFNNTLFRNYRGFTLVELMVTTALLVTASVVTIAAYNQYSESQKIQNAALDVSLLLQKAKSRAQSQVKPGGVNACQSNSLRGYEVRICNVPQAKCAEVDGYELHAICGNSSVSLEKKKLPSPVKFANASDPTFFFQVLKGSVNSGIIRLNYNSVQKTIQVSGPGYITIQ